MAERDAADFVDSWKQLDGQFDEVARLRELRKLVAQGAVSQEVYDQLHRYTLEKKMSAADKKKLERRRAQAHKGGKAPAAPAAAAAAASGSGPAAAAGTSKAMARVPSGRAIKGRQLPRPPSLLKALKPGESKPTGRPAGRSTDPTATVVANFDGDADWGAKPVMEGFLYKRATQSGRNWKRRYVRLFYDRLEYFANKGDRAPRGEIKITKNLFVADSILRRIKNSRAHGFMISDFGTTYYLAASSAESKVYWMHTIRRVIQRLKDLDEAADAPVLLDRPVRSKEEEQEDMKKRMAAYRRSQSEKLSPVGAVARAAAMAELRRSSASSASKRHSGGSKKKKHGSTKKKHGSTKRGSKKRGESEKPALESPASEGDVTLSERDYNVSLRGGSSSGDDDDNGDGDRDLDSEDDDGDSIDDVRPQSMLGRPRTLSGARGGVTSAALALRGSLGPRATLPDERARSQASAAFAAHASARLSAKTQLGMDVVSYAEQEEMRDAAARADAARFVADLENEAALTAQDEALRAERALREELRKSRKQPSKSAAEEEDAALLRKEYEATKQRLAELEATLARTAAERAEAEEMADRSRQEVARAAAANAVVLELAKVDEAILRAEQLAEAAEAARARAEAAARAVQQDAEMEASQRSDELAEAERQATAAAQLEAEREEQERRILAKLEETATQQISERQRQKVQEMAEKAAAARAEAEEQRFQAELEATRLASERLDAAQKAAAVQRALRGTQAIIDKSRQRSGLEEYDFARPRDSGEAQKPVSASAPAKPRAAAAAPAPAPAAAAAAPAAPAEKQRPTSRRQSLLDKLRPRRSLDKKGNGGKAAKLKAKQEREHQARINAKKEEEERRRRAAQEKAQVRPDEEQQQQQQQEPEEAASAFQSFFRQFTQAAMGGIEYVTGLQLTGGDDADTASVPRNRGRGQDTRASTLTYDDDEDLDEDDDDESLSVADDFDEQLRAVGEAERIKAASAWIEFEIRRLLEVIHDIGQPDEYGRPVTTFKELLEVYEDISDTLVGILLRAKRAGKVFYEGDMLFEIEHDEVEVVALE